MRNMKEIRVNRKNFKKWIRASEIPTSTSSSRTDIGKEEEKVFQILDGYF